MTAAKVDPEKVPSLARGCRLAKDKVLLLPEGIIKLSQSALQILKLCDGQQTVAQITALLQAEFAPELHEKIRTDVEDFISKLSSTGALELR